MQQVGGTGYMNGELHRFEGSRSQVVVEQGVVNTSFKNSAETARKKCKFAGTLA
jgi:hypothetical protein